MISELVAGVAVVTFKLWLEVRLGGVITVELAGGGTTEPLTDDLVVE